MSLKLFGLHPIRKVSMFGTFEIMGLVAGGGAATGATVCGRCGFCTKAGDYEKNEKVNLHCPSKVMFDVVFCLPSPTASTCFLQNEYLNRTHDILYYSMLKMT